MPQYGGLVLVQWGAQQSFEEQPHGVQRLAQVVAGSGQEARFVLAGAFGGFLCQQGALGLGAQLRDQTLVFKFQFDAVARGLRQVARVQAGQAVVGGHQQQGGQDHHGGHHQHGQHGAADGAAQVEDVGAVHGRTQAQRT